MNHTAVQPASAPLYWIIRGVFIESFRRREFSVILLFMGLFVLAAIVNRIVGVESDAAAAFIFNFGLSLSWILSAIATVIVAARQFPDELETRSLYPILAKPLARSQYVLGKWLACWFAGIAALTLLNLIALVTVPWPRAMSLGLLLQTFLLQVISMGAVTAISIALSIRLPKAMTIVITLLLVFAGGPLIGLLNSYFTSAAAIRWVTAYIPDFARLDLINSLTYGGTPLPMIHLLAHTVYGLIIALFAISIGMLMLERKPL